MAPVHWTPEALKILAKNYQTIKEFRIAHPGAYQSAWKKGLLHTLGLCSQVAGHSNENRRAPIIWTFEAVKLEAAKYTSRSAFSVGSSGAYMSARRYGWLDDLGLPKKEIKWTYVRTKQEAAKYASRSLFALGNRAAYNKARQMKWLDDFFPK